MPYTRVYIHLVWATKNRYPFLTKKVRPKVIDHIKAYARKQDIQVMVLNGFVDHLHCLIELNKMHSIAQTVQFLKGESSHWVNKEGLCKSKFQWQSEYFAESVGRTELKRVQSYIRNQEDHHRHETYSEQWQNWLADAKAK